mmetsp:Transcript_26443/g.55571  ORF Transcript_26443/g.55571 Transcript_26443/m.55571 type:complete len:114 (+) Transcript_26443:52-393(+)
MRQSSLFRSERDRTNERMNSSIPSFISSRDAPTKETTTASETNGATCRRCERTRPTSEEVALASAANNDNDNQTEDTKVTDDDDDDDDELGVERVGKVAPVISVSCFISVSIR